MYLTEDRRLVSLKWFFMVNETYCLFLHVTDPLKLSKMLSHATHCEKVQINKMVQVVFPFEIVNLRFLGDVWALVIYSRPRIQVLVS